jgi:molecular chaperone DnaJ
MKYTNIAILSMIIIGIIQSASGQSDNTTEFQTELIVTDEQKIILFAGFTAAVIGIFIYLARDMILRKKTSYDSAEVDSKKDKTYEKYHSSWSDDYEEFGTRKNTKEEKEFRVASQNSSLPDYYKILDLPYDATYQEIKKQYRKLAKKTHPDKNKDEKSEETMIQINKAYEVLSNEALREKYDRYINKD